MSLLNDALRKKQREKKPPVPGIIGPNPEIAPKSSKKRFWLVTFSFVTGFAIVYGAWLYWSLSETSFTSTRAQTAKHIETPQKSPPPGSPLDMTAPEEPSVPVILLPETKSQKPLVPDKKSDNKATQLPTLIVSPTSKVEKKSISAEPAEVPLKKKPAVAPKPTPEPIQRNSTPKEPSPKPEPTADAPPAPAPVSAAVERQQRLQRLYQSARRLHKQGLNHQAVGLYQQFLKENPEHVEARINLVLAYIQLKQFVHALPMTTELHLQYPDNTQILLQLAIVNLGIEEPLQALTYLEKLSQHSRSPKFEIALYKGIAHRRLDQNSQAISWYQKAEALDPHDPRLLFNLAVAFDGNQQYPQAIAYYLKYLTQIKTDPDQNKQIRERIRTLRAYQSRQ